MKRFLASLRLFWRSDFHFIRNKMIREPFYLRAGARHCKVEGGGLAEAGWVYDEIVVRDIYGILKYAKKNKPVTIVDIGAHIGMFSKLASLLFPEVEIHAYEPNPHVLPVLVRNAQGTNIKVFPYGVLDKCGVAMMGKAPDQAASFFKAGKNGGDVPVNMVSAADIFKGKVIDFLKMDCEGSEWSIFSDAAFLKRVKTLRMEYHLEGRSLDDLTALIERSQHRIDFLESLESNDGVLWSRNRFL